MQNNKPMYKFGTKIEIVDRNKEAYDIMYRRAIECWGVFVEPIEETAKIAPKVRAYVHKPRPKQDQPQV